MRLGPVAAAGINNGIRSLIPVSSLNISFFAQAAAGTGLSWQLAEELLLEPGVPVVLDVVVGPTGQMRGNYRPP